MGKGTHLREMYPKMGKRTQKQVFEWCTQNSGYKMPWLTKPRGTKCRGTTVAIEGSISIMPLILSGLNLTCMFVCHLPFYLVCLHVSDHQLYCTN